MSEAASLTIVILTLNEAANLPRCLDALPDAYPVVVLDSGSTDDTASLAVSRRCRVCVNAWPGFAAQRNHALEACQINTPWVLFVDADEVFPAEVFDWYERELADRADVDAAMVPSSLIFEGKRLRHAPGYPIYHARFAHRTRARFVPHTGEDGEGFAPDVRTVTATASYDHHLYAGELRQWMHKHVDTADRSTRRVSGPTAVTRRNRLSRLLRRSLLRVPLRFFYHYVFRLGFLDGRAGWHYAIMYAWYEATRYVYHHARTERDDD